ncbi:MAG: hypothetical protein WA753_07240, partial [Pseudolabrys sp.]
DGARLFCRPDSGNGGDRFGAADHDRAGTNGRMEQGRLQERRVTQVYGLFDCAVQMYVDVKTYTSFAAITQTPPVTNGQLDPLKVSYSPGGVGDIEVVTLYYAWPIYVSLLGNNLADMGSNRLLVATAVFRNEPYQ